METTDTTYTDAQKAYLESLPPDKRKWHETRMLIKNQLAEIQAREDLFAAEFGVRPFQWGPSNINRMLRATGAPPDQVAAMWDILGWLSSGTRGELPWRRDGYTYGRWLNRQWGVFDHGKLWGRDRTPTMIVGHPYHFSNDDRPLLEELGRFSGLTVNVDDRAGYYGFGSHHVRIALTEIRKPFPS